MPPPSAPPATGVNDMAIFRPQIAMSYLEQTISNIRPIARRFPNGFTAQNLRVHEELYDRLRKKHWIERCDLIARDGGAES